MIDRWKRAPGKLNSQRRASERQFRSCCGAMIAEGAAASILLTAMIVGGVLLLMGTGTLVYYKIKLAYIADAGARLAAQQMYWMGAPRLDFDANKAVKLVSDQVSSQLAAMGMPQGKVSSVDFSVKNNTMASVTISVSALPIMSGDLLPKFVSMTETAVEPYNIESPPAVYEVGCYPSGPGDFNKLQGIVYVPCYGAYSTDPLNDPLPPKQPPPLPQLPPDPPSYYVVPTRTGYIAPDNPAILPKPGP